MLKLLIILPVIGIFIINLISIPLISRKETFNIIKKNFLKKEIIRGRLIGIIITIIELYISLYILLIINNNNQEYQLREIIDLNIFRINLGIDGIGLSLILITTITMPILIILKSSKNNITKEMILNEIQIIKNILIMESILIIIFTIIDLFGFYIMYELILIPMFILIGKFGSKIRRVEAAYRFIIYTMTYSLLLLISIIFIYLKYGTTNNELLQYKFLIENKDILKILWIAFFFSFAVKIPMFPFHTWLPEAHAEAPTIGSIILAGILLKLGSFGFIKYSLYLFNTINIYFSPLIFILSLLSIIYGGLTTIRQIDLKKIIAYSSIVHMSYVMIGLYLNDIIGLNGSSYLMISHAFVSSGLFLLVGILYIRYHTRIILYYRGLTLMMPIFASFFLLFSIANMSIPLTSSFIGEMLIMFSTFKYNILIAIIIALSLILGTTYVIWLTNRILFGKISKNLLYFNDITLIEFYTLLPLIIFVFIFGIFSKPLLNLYTLPLLNLIY